MKKLSSNAKNYRLWQKGLAKLSTPPPIVTVMQDGFGRLIVLKSCLEEEAIYVLERAAQEMRMKLAFGAHTKTNGYTLRKPPARAKAASRR